MTESDQNAEIAILRRLQAQRLIFIYPQIIIERKVR